MLLERTLASNEEVSRENKSTSNQVRCGSNSDVLISSDDRDDRAFPSSCETHHKDIEGMLLGRVGPRIIWAVWPGIMKSQLLFLEVLN